MEKIADAQRELAHAMHLAALIRPEAREPRRPPPERSSATPTLPATPDADAAHGESTAGYDILTIVDVDLDAVEAQERAEAEAQRAAAEARLQAQRAAAEARFQLAVMAASRIQRFIRRAPRLQHVRFSRATAAVRMQGVLRGKLTRLRFMRAGREMADLCAELDMITGGAPPRSYALQAPVERAAALATPPMPQSSRTTRPWGMRQ